MVVHLHADSTDGLAMVGKRGYLHEAVAGAAPSRPGGTPGCAIMIEHGVHYKCVGVTRLGLGISCGLVGGIAV